MDAEQLRAIQQRFEDARPDDKHSLIRDDNEPWAWQWWADIGDLLEYIKQLQLQLEQQKFQLLQLQRTIEEQAHTLRQRWKQ